jgi:hypothetical protein
MVDIIVVNYNSSKYLIKFIESVQKYTNPDDYKIIVVDNGSEKSEEQYLMQLFYNNTKIKLLFVGRNIGYGQAIQKAYDVFIRNNNVDFFIFSNADVELIHENWLPRLLYVMSLKKYNAGIIAPKFIFPNGILAGTGFIGNIKNFKIRGWKVKDKGQFNKREIMFSLCGAFLLVRKKAFDEVNGFDPQFKMYFEETDLIIRMKQKGYNAVYEPAVTVIHHYNKSPNFEKTKLYKESLQLFCKKYNI